MTSPPCSRSAFFRSVLVAAIVPEAAHAAALDGTALRWPWALPFVGILVTIAAGPLLFPRLWHHHYGKFAFVWSALAIVPIAALYDVPTATAAFVHALLAEYLSFIVLLFTLYVVAGGILVTGELRGTPLTNTAILAFGTLIASIVGTTGAAMILIRPLLRANANRLHNAHVVVFFIILVANVGGALSPLGDPPLFVGFLRGVEFFWTTQHMWLQTAILAVIVLAMFVVVDIWFHRQDKRVTLIGEPPLPPDRLRVQGNINFLLLAAVIAVILIASQWKPGVVYDIAGTKVQLQELMRDGTLIAIAILSLVLTPNEHRDSNGFTWEPIREVAILFAGIFACIVPVLAMLQAGKAGAFGWLPQLIEDSVVPNEVALFLAHRRAVGVPRQCADLSGVLRACRRQRADADDNACADACRDLNGRGLHGSADLYRQRAQPHGLRHRRGARHQDAGLRRLHVLGDADPAAGTAGDHFRLPRALARFARRALGATCCAWLGAALSRPSAGSATTTSTSSSAPSRAKLEPPSVVEAGSAAALR